MCKFLTNSLKYGTLTKLFFIKSFKTSTTVWAALSLLGLCACNPYRYLAADQSLVTKNAIVGITPDYEEKALSIVQPQPNRRLLLIGPKLRLVLYLRAISGVVLTHRDSIVIDKIGEPPALFDSVKIVKSTEQLQSFLFNKGHFGSKVGFAYTTKRKRTKVNYLVQETPAYTIVSINYFETQKPIDQEINRLKDKLDIKIGDNYDLDKLDQERTRITKTMREQGYMLFNKDLITINIDTNYQNTRKLALVFSTKSTEEPHIYKVFRYDSIVVNTNYDIFALNNFSNSTAYKVKDYLFYTSKISPTNPLVIANSILFKPGDLYSESKMRLTQSRLSELNVFSYVNSQLIPVIAPNSQKVNVNILLAPAKKRDLKLGFEVTTLSGSNLGVSAVSALRNKNFFGGAEVLALQANGGLETQLGVGTLPRVFGIFNTYELGLSSSLYIPRFVFLFKKTAIAQKAEAARTNIGISVLRQARAEYTRFIAKGSLGYEWKADKATSWGFYPIELNLGRTPFLDPVFRDSILQKDPYQIFSFGSHFTTDTRISYTKNLLAEKEGYFLRTSIESAGNLYAVGAKALGGTPDKIFGLPIFRYVRADFDLRKYIRTDPNNVLAFRGFVGVGLPLGKDSLTLPIEKLYIIGGSNSLRGWNARELGPSKNNYYKDRTAQFAELKIEASAEYRLKITKAINLAFFGDVGNIYSLANGSDNGFELKNFYKYLAINTGVGLRYDISYVVLRLDYGLKLRDPAFWATNAWVISHLFDKNWTRTQWKQDLNTTSNYKKYPFFVPQIGVGIPF